PPTRPSWKYSSLPSVRLALLRYSARTLADDACHRITNRTVVPSDDRLKRPRLSIRHARRAGDTLRRASKTRRALVADDLTITQRDHPVGHIEQGGVVGRHERGHPAGPDDRPQQVHDGASRL